MKKSERAQTLQDALYSALREDWPTISVQVIEIHQDRWLAGHVIMGKHSITAYDFSMRVTNATDRVTSETPYRGEICRWETSVCRIVDGGRCYSFWLPVAPLTKKDFRMFRHEALGKAELEPV